MNKLTVAQARALLPGDAVVFVLPSGQECPSIVERVEKTPVGHELPLGHHTVVMTNGFEFLVRPWLEADSIAADSSSSDGYMFLRAP